MENPTVRTTPVRPAAASGRVGTPNHVTPVHPVPGGSGRDRYLDLLRAIALVRVVAYHTFSNAAWLSLVFPSMGVMFALAGSLMARSLERPALGVLKSRTRRLLLPLWVYSATVLVLQLWQGWSPDQEEGRSWPEALLWFIPLGDPPFPESIGSDEGLVDTVWAQDAGVILWYIRAYFWFMLLSPLLLAAFRRLPWDNAGGAPRNHGAHCRGLGVAARLGGQRRQRLRHLRLLLDSRFRPLHRDAEQDPAMDRLLSRAGHDGPRLPLGNTRT